MSAAALDSNCQREKISIKGILDSNQMTMTQVVKDRLNVMRTLKEIGVPYREVKTELWWDMLASNTSLKSIKNNSIF